MENHIKQNNMRVYLLMTGLTSIMLLMGLLISHLFDFGITGTSIFVIISIVINILAYFFSHKIVLKASHAKSLAYDQSPDLFEMVKRLCDQESLPMPKLYLMEERTINAFATGRNKDNSVIAVTRGLLERLSYEEIEGVVAHEIAHIKNNDMRLMTVVAVIAGIITLIADMYWYSQIGNALQDKDRSGFLAWIGIIVAILAPISAFFIQLSISRKREYLADATSASITSNPKGLASALSKIKLDVRLPKHRSAATAHLYFSASSLPKNEDRFFDRIFSTHPPIQNRIDQLEKMVRFIN